MSLADHYQKELVERGDIEIIEWLHHNGFPLKTSDYPTVMAYGQLIVLEWMYKQKIPLPNECIYGRMDN